MSDMDALFNMSRGNRIGAPSKVQGKAIPSIILNQDVVAQAASVQERLQAYVIPAIHIILDRSRSPSKSSDSEDSLERSIRVVIVTATADQAAQSHKLCFSLGSPLGVRSFLAIGQSDLGHELHVLQVQLPHVLIGTPQRLFELFACGLRINNCELLVLDEADQLVARNMGELILNIHRLLSSSVAPTVSSFDPFDGEPLNAAPGSQSSKWQTVMFSASVPEEVLNFASSLKMREPVRMLVRRDTTSSGGEGLAIGRTVSSLRHHFIYISVAAKGRKESLNAWKLETLGNLCEDIDFRQAVVFCSSVEAVEAASYKLASKGINALALVSSHPSHLSFYVSLRTKTR
jgi:superfamily II DNA/RNA helicase